MALTDGSLTDLTHAINKTTPVVLDHTGLYFSPVVADGQSPTRVRTRITAQPYYQYDGTYVVAYDRLDLSELGQRLPSPPRLRPKARLYGLLTELRRELGIHLGTDDVYDAEVSSTETGYTVEVTAKPESFGWVGSCTLPFRDLPPLAVPLHTTHIDW